MRRTKKEPKAKAAGKGRCWRRLCGWLGGLALGWSLLPLLVNGIFNEGVAVGMAAGLLGIAWALGWRWKQKGWYKPVAIVLLCFVCVFGMLGLVLSGCMVGAAVTRPGREDATVIVLGALIVGDQPSRMLRGRLDAAANRLEKYPDAVCVVSGGQGADEAYSEAYVMRKYLVEQRGIAPERIYMEDRSTNTFENTRFSMELIRREGLCDTVAIATQEFHQYRAAATARRAGATGVGAVTCFSPPHLLLCYWVRECAAICRLWILGY